MAVVLQSTLSRKKKQYRHCPCMLDGFNDALGELVVCFGDVTPCLMGLHIVDQNNKMCNDQTLTAYSYITHTHNLQCLTSDHQ